MKQAVWIERGQSRDNWRVRQKENTCNIENREERKEKSDHLCETRNSLKSVKKINKSWMPASTGTKKFGNRQ